MGVHYLTFDLPPSVNEMYERRRGGGVRLSDKARNWKDYAVIMAMNQWGQHMPLDGKLCVTYRFFGSRADWDNGCKILGDCMNKIVYHDDRQIIQAHVYLYREEKQTPRVEVEIQTIG